MYMSVRLCMNVFLSTCVHVFVWACAIIRHTMTDTYSRIDRVEKVDEWLGWAAHLTQQRTVLNIPQHIIHTQSASAQREQHHSEHKHQHRQQQKGWWFRVCCILTTIWICLYTRTIILLLSLVQDIRETIATAHMTCVRDCVFVYITSFTNHAHIIANYCRVWYEIAITTNVIMEIDYNKFVVHHEPSEEI